MGKEEAKLFLYRPRRIQNKIYRLQQKKAALESCLYPSGIRYDSDRVQSSPEDKTSKVCAEIRDIEKEIKNLCNKKEEAYIDIIHVLDKIEGQNADDERTVLYGYFVGMNSIEKISMELNLSRRSTYNRFHSGLASVGNLI